MARLVDRGGDRSPFGARRLDAGVVAGAPRRERGEHLVQGRAQTRVRPHPLAEGLGAPWGSDFMVPPRDLRAPSLRIDTEFLHACVLGDLVDFDLWVRRMGRSSFELALPGGVAGQVRLRAIWTLCAISFATGRAVPLPDDLRRAMARFLAA